jgi:hypothetical protein
VPRRGPARMPEGNHQPLAKRRTRPTTIMKDGTNEPRWRCGPTFELLSGRQYASLISLPPACSCGRRGLACWQTATRKGGQASRHHLIDRCSRLYPASQHYRSPSPSYQLGRAPSHIQLRSELRLVIHHSHLGWDILCSPSQFLSPRIGAR